MEWGIIKSFNLAVRFLLELCALAAIGYWGFKIGETILAKIIPGIGIPAVIAVVWGAFYSPAAPNPVPLPLKLVVELIIFGGSFLALYAAGQSNLAISFAVATFLNRLLMLVWHQ